MTPNPFIFAPMLAMATLLFCVSCFRRFSLLAVGTADDRTGKAGRRLKAVLAHAFGQKRVLSRPFGVNHFFIFWSFIILLAANGEFLLKGIFPGVSFELLPASLHHGLLWLFDAVSL